MGIAMGQIGSVNEVMEMMIGGSLREESRVPIQFTQSIARKPLSLYRHAEMLTRSA